MKGLLLINKPPGWTSFDVVAKVRSEISKKTGHKIKVGHAGTLDPFATGLLIVLIGNTTKRQNEFMKLDKEYEAVLKLGYSSTTGDPEGEIKIVSDKKPEVSKIKEVLKQFHGEITQTPPQFSAIKIKGKPAYHYARNGEKVGIKPRKITLKSIEILKYQYPLLHLKIRCSSGTYIRTLANDIGQKLNTGAYLVALKRTKIGNHKLSCSSDIKDLKF